jgi:hypothetical protein
MPFVIYFKINDLYFIIGLACPVSIQSLYDFVRIAPQLERQGRPNGPASAGQVLFQIMLRALAGDHLEVLVKTSEIIEPAFEAQLFYADPVVDKQFTGMPNPYFRDELGIGLTCSGFEIAAE